MDKTHGAFQERNYNAIVIDMVLAMITLMLCYTYGYTDVVLASIILMYNTIQYNSRLLKISKLTKAATAITGYNIAYNYSNQLMFPHRKQSTANT